MSEREIRITRTRPPGRRRGRASPTLKGRQVGQAARREVAAALAEMPRSRDLLIEYLHRLQDRYGWLTVGHLAALAERLGLAQAEVYEVASFYDRFDVVADDAGPPPEATVRVCDGLVCVLHGATGLLSELRSACPPSVRVRRAPCLGRCDRAPAALVDERELDWATAPALLDCLAGRRPAPQPPAIEDIAACRERGGYRVLRDCLAGRRTPREVLRALEDSRLRGLGGAGFPPGRKWELVRDQPAPRALVVNADESEPGTFKDRHHLLHDPHRVLEGALIAAWAVGTETSYLYLRDEYPAVRRVLTAAIAGLAGTGLARHTRIELRRGAGAYVCGEESAMIESIEGKRGLPRHRPPYVAEVGVHGRPTLVNNVETLYWVPEILARGPAWFADHGHNGGQGLRSYSVSGRVADPGVKVAPAGISARALIDQHSGGMAPGQTLKAFLPGGASGGFLPAAMADLPLDFGTLEPHGSFVGSHGLIVLGQDDDLRQAALNVMEFFAEESCGKCTPCRVGTDKAVRLMGEARWDPVLMEDLGRVLADASICGLGQAAANPLRTLLRHFPEALSP